VHFFASFCHGGQMYQTRPIKHLLPFTKVMALISIWQSKSTKLWHLLPFATSGIRK